MISSIVFMLMMLIPAEQGKPVDKNCLCGHFKLYGKNKIVNDFPDLKVQVVENFPDLKIKFVENFPGLT